MIIESHNRTMAPVVDTRRTLSVGAHGGGEETEWVRFKETKNGRVTLRRAGLSSGNTSQTDICVGAVIFILFVLF